MSTASPRGTPQRKDLGPTQLLLISLVREDPSATVQDLSNRMGRSIPVIRNMIRRLAEIHGIRLDVPGAPEIKPNNVPGGPN